MKIINHIYTLIVLTVVSLPTAAGLTSCSDDLPKERTETDIFGLWSDGSEHFLDISDSQFINEYTFCRSEIADEYSYWLNTRVSYFYEPASYLLLKDNRWFDEETMQIDSRLSLYKVVSYDESEMVMCWLSNPELGSMEGDSKYDFFRIFFESGYVEDPANYITLHRITREELDETVKGNIIDL